MKGVSGVFEIHIGEVGIRLYFGFFAVILLFFYISGQQQAMIAAALISCLLHEMGHIAAMCLFSQPPDKICFYAGGIKIIPKRCTIEKRSVSLVVYSAGCAVNFLLAAISFYIGQKSFSQINFALGAFNLLPFSYFDGGRLISLYASQSARRTAAVIFGAVFAYAALTSGTAAALLLAFALFAEAVMSG